jgi:hypothetical protein
MAEMGAFLRGGGWSTWMVLLLGGICLGCAVRFAWRPESRRLPLVRTLTWATVFAILAGLAANATAVLAHMQRTGPGESEVERWQTWVGGLGEVLAPAVLGFTLLALAWMFAAVGTRRMQDPRE